MSDSTYWQGVKTSCANIARTPTGGQRRTAAIRTKSPAASPLALKIRQLKDLAPSSTVQSLHVFVDERHQSWPFFAKRHAEFAFFALFQVHLWLRHAPAAPFQPRLRHVRA